MSESIEVTKSVDINIQIDYVECGECGKELTFSVNKDSYGDLQITVGSHSCDY